MGKKMIALLCAAALFIGGAAAWWAHGAPTPDPAGEAVRTDQIAVEMKDTMETVTARIEKQDTQTRTEVRVIRETVRKKVEALPPDSVADGLNAELALFRGVEAGPGGLDSN
jgi:hypothetical protein